MRFDDVREKARKVIQALPGMDFSGNPSPGAASVDALLMAAQQYLEKTICTALLQLQLPQVEGSHMLVVGTGAHVGVLVHEASWLWRVLIDLSKTQMMRWMTQWNIYHFVLIPIDNLNCHVACACKFY